MTERMQARFDSPYGQVIWRLPQDTTDALAHAPPDVREKALEAFGSHLTILCGAMLKSFGNPGMGETLNLIMQELREIITADDR